MRPSPGPTPQLSFPALGAAHDGIQIVKTRLPAQSRADALGARHEPRRIPGAARLLAHAKLHSRHALDARQHFAHAVAVTVADVERGGFAAAAQVGERIDV